MLPNQQYQPPPVQDKLNLFDASIEEISARIDPMVRLDKALMNVCQGFGPLTAREIAFKSSTVDDALKLLVELKTIEPTPTLIMDGNKKVLAISSLDLTHVEGKKIHFETMSALLEAADRLIGSYVPPDKDVFTRLIRNELHRATNKIEVLSRELSESENAADWKILADNLSTYRYQHKDHADDAIEVDNIYNQSEKIKIPLDRKLTIAANVQALYKKYDKLKRGAKFINEQIGKCGDEIKYLKTIEHSLTTATTLADIDEIRAELIAGGYIKQASKRAASSKKSAPIVLRAPDGTEILIGKNNVQNDRLRQSAAPNDIWLHTKDIPGSHVILKCGDVEPSDETLLFAAKVAAHFSQASGSSKVPVDYIKCRSIKKPSGSRPGFVIFVGQKTLYVTPEENFLLDRE